jgi:hypothetical protein
MHVVSHTEAKVDGCTLQKSGRKWHIMIVVMLLFSVESFVRGEGKELAAEFSLSCGTSSYCIRSGFT